MLTSAENELPGSNEQQDRPQSRTLQLTGDNREEDARILGIGARTLYRKLKESGE